MRYIVLGLLCLMLLLSACEIKDFALPVWDVDLSIPLVNEQYYVSDLVDSVHIFTDQNELLQLVTSGELHTEEVFSVHLNPAIELSDMPVIAQAPIQFSIPFQDSENNVQISYGKIASGSLRYRFDILSSEVEAIIMQFEDIHDPSGAALSLEYSSEEWVEVDLSGYSIGSLQSNNSLDSLRISLSTHTAQDPGTMIANLDFQMQEVLYFEEFRGRIDHYEVSAADPAATLEVEYPYNLDQAITLSDAFIRIDVFNELGFSCEFEGVLKASSNGNTVEVPIVDDAGNNYRIPPATDTEPGTITLPFHENISTLMQIMPRQIELVQAKFVIDSASGFGSLKADDEITANYTIEAPFIFSLHEYPIEIDSVLVISIPEENRDRIAKNLMQAKLDIQVKNTIPIGAVASAYFSSSSDLDPADPQTYAFVKSVSIDSRDVDAGWQDIPQLELSKEELMLFSAPEVYLKWVFSFQESGGPVEIYATTADYLAIKGSLAATIRVEE